MTWVKKKEQVDEEEGDNWEEVRTITGDARAQRKERQRQSEKDEESDRMVEHLSVINKQRQLQQQQQQQQVDMRQVLNC